jgi:hypothetical protein
VLVLKMLRGIFHLRFVRSLFQHIITTTVEHIIYKEDQFDPIVVRKMLRKDTRVSFRLVEALGL